MLAQLRTIDGLDGAIQRIFVDYSSMSKIWYAAILSWARYLPDGAVSIDFGYATGRPTIPYRHSAIRSIEAIPGFEATTGSDAGVLVLGLGFDRFMTASVVDQMEPDKVVVFLADPSTDPKYVAYAKRVHASVLGQTVDADDVVAMPLLSVEESFRLLAEVVLPYTDRARVTIVPLGPKTHVLAALLVSMRFPHVGCLRVSTATTTRRSEPTHEISIARVFLDSPV